MRDGVLSHFSKHMHFYPKITLTLSTSCRTAAPSALQLWLPQVHAADGDSALALFSAADLFSESGKPNTSRGPGLGCWLCVWLPPQMLQRWAVSAVCRMAPAQGLATSQGRPVPSRGCCLPVTPIKQPGLQGDGFLLRNWFSAEKLGVSHARARNGFQICSCCVTG